MTEVSFTAISLILFSILFLIATHWVKQKYQENSGSKYKKAVLGGGGSAEIVHAAEPWVTENFQKYNTFYILGV